MVESSALLKRRSPKGYRGFESLPHRFRSMITLNRGTFLLFRIRSIIH